MEKHPVLVPTTIFAGLDAVRRSGVTNMFDRPRVIALAETWGYAETADWLREHHQEYARGIFHSFRVREEGDTPCADSQG
jgi:hypothetical protein